MALAQAPPPAIRFNRDIRPILSERCIACHGPDARRRQADFRLDRPEDALGDRGGYRAIVPGKPADSELVKRITAADPEMHMPPPEAGPRLTPAEIERITRWIAEGATWEGHWAFEPVRRPAVPEVARAEWPRNAVDRFVLSRLEREGWAPAADADRVTLARRLAFDLTGLPPTVEAVDAFVGDPAPDAVERAVDRLLASPHYGERMALVWLDLVRFADSRGYHSDNPRSVAPFRDYVIRAFNENLPFDRFTIEQLAGDLLERPTLWQRVASGYNKLNLTTEEGGAQPKEYEAKNSADRVRNAASVWLGGTLACAECHHHKFDPYTTEDFYRFAAFFADVQEPPIADRDPGMGVPDEAQAAELEGIDARIAALTSELERTTPALEEAQRAWEAQTLERMAQAPKLGPWRAVGPFVRPTPGEAFREAFPPEREFDPSAAYEDGRLKWVEHPEWEDGKPHALKGENAATYLARTITSPIAQSLELSLGSDDAISVWVNGKSVLSKEVYRPLKPDEDKLTVELAAGDNLLLMKIVNGNLAYGFFFRPILGGPPDAVRAILTTAPADRTESQASALAAHYRSIAPLLEPARRERASVQARKEALVKKLPRMLVSVSGPPRVVRILPRGNWLDESGPPVTPAIPKFLGALDVGERRATRLDLARWITARENPLTARVFVNRLWALFFGTGLSRVLDDVGAQGEWPVHPELLDWLAAEFMQSGWDVKHVVRLLVTSRAYRQDARAAPGLRERDPDNRLIARQSRWRLPAEFVRDNALAVSGLLSPRIGGPSVKPYQPRGYWAHLNFPKREWENGKDEDLYRRGIYTWWQRTFVHPAMIAFDAPSREECCAARPRSNIPQQALVLLNDPQFVEAARALAARILADGGAGEEQRLRWAFRRVLSRAPKPEELKVLAELRADHLKQYRDDPKAAEELLAVGAAPNPPEADRAELASWTSVARALLNLHETVTRN
jgi:hypothetical protein